MVATRTIFIVGAVFLFLIFGVFIIGYANGDLSETFGFLNSLLLNKRMTITSPEQMEQLFLCLHQRAQGCQHVDEGVWDLLENSPYENCPCGGDFMAGTDVHVDFNFKDDRYYTFSDTDFADFAKVGAIGRACNVRVTENWVEFVPHTIVQFKKYLLINNQNEEQGEKTVWNMSEGVIVVNTRRTLGTRLAEMFGMEPGARLIQGCLVIKKN